MLDTQKDHYFLLTLRDLVIFPNNIVSLFVGREKSVEAVKQAIQNDRMIVLVPQKDKSLAVPTIHDLHSVGVLCEILQMLKMPDGNLKLLLEASKRVYLKKVIDNGDYFTVKVDGFETESLSEENLKELNFLDKAKYLFDIFSKFNNVKKVVPSKYLQDIFKAANYELLIDIVSHTLTLPFDKKQTILSLKSLPDRLEEVTVALEKELDLLTVEQSIQEKVKTKIDKAQKNFLLQEQLKTIREELNEDAEDVEKYRKQMQEKNLPEEVTEKLESEIKKLERTPIISAEHMVLRNYIECVLGLPWSTALEGNLNIKNAEEILSSSHYGLDKVKDRFLEFIAVYLLSRKQKGVILCLVGPPGVGKTSLAKSLAKALGRAFVRISLGGVRDEADIRGHRRTYIGALPGRLISALTKVKVNNPVILLDEVDKLSSDMRTNPSAALLEVLDSEQNKEFVDHYLELPFNLSNIIFIATANSVDYILPPLLDRMEVVRLSGYTEEEKIHISTCFLLPKLLEEHGIAHINMKNSETSLLYLIRRYTKEAGVRQLERVLAQLLRKIARDYLSKTSLSYFETEADDESYINNIKEDQESFTYTWNESFIEKHLDPPKYQYGIIESQKVIGMSNGLAWTPAGGDILFIEVALTHGKGSINITGNLGNVMEESVNTAIGYVKSQNHRLGLSEDFFEKTDIFLHVPEGAIPKDGPSAGVAIVIALISTITQYPVKNTVAMTGEVTLRGKVLPIGGLKEKVLAAFRGGIVDIICPKNNKKDLKDMPKSLLSTITFHFVDTVEEALGLALDSTKLIFIEPSRNYSFGAKHLLSLEKIEPSSSLEN